METKNKTRAVMYDVSSGEPKFCKSKTLPDGVKDVSAEVYNTTIALFLLIDGRDINMIAHDNSVIASSVERSNGIITKIRPLITCTIEHVEIYPNGNIEYRGFDIIKSGKIGSRTDYSYAICRDDNMLLDNIDSLDDALDRIDKAESM